MKPEDFLTPEGKLKRYTKPTPVEYDTRLSTACNSDTKERFKACCDFLDMAPDDTLQIILTDYIENVVEYAAGHCSDEYELVFDDAKKHLQDPQ